jgi:uncharacterized membrane protein
MADAPREPDLRAVANPPSGVPAVEDDGAKDYGSTERGAAERLTFFSDAVVAIAITLLAIDLQVPRGNSVSELAAGFAANWNEYLTFLISFAVIARHWITHHRAFRYIGRASTGVVRLNMLWLLLIVVTPFLTRVIDEGPLDLARFGLYALAQSLQVGVFALLVAVLAHQQAFVPGTPEHLRRRGWVLSVVTGIGFLASIPLFPLLGPWAFALWAVIPAVLGRILAATGVLGHA